MICRGAFKYTKEECSTTGTLCTHYIPHDIIWDGSEHCECKTKLCYSPLKNLKYRRIGKCISEFEGKMHEAILRGENARTRKSKKSN
jgi:hypothetical protein